LSKSATTQITYNINTSYIENSLPTPKSKDSGGVQKTEIEVYSVKGIIAKHKKKSLNTREGLINIFIAVRGEIKIIKNLLNRKLNPPKENP